MASPGQILATQPSPPSPRIWNCARDFGRSLAIACDRLPLYSIEIAPAFDPAWMTRVAMHAPYESYRIPATPHGSVLDAAHRGYRRSPEVTIWNEVS